MLKIWRYFNYKDHFNLCDQRKTNAFLGRLGMLLEVSGGSQTCNMIQLGDK